MAQILIIEDEVLLAKSLSRALTVHGHVCAIANSAEEGLSLLEKMPTDLVLMDIQLPGISGLEAIRKIRQHDPNISVMIATAYGTMAAAVEALRSGACDFLRKPLDTEEVILAVDRAVDGARLRQTISYYQEIEAGKTEDDQLVAESDAMKSITKVIEKIKSMNLETISDFPPVLITGETGVGKDLVARLIHFRSRHSDKPFIEVNCTTLPRGLEEAELFGYEKGAFTGADRSKRGLFEAAEGGTIFLNEIGDLVIEAQVKLLQAIEQKTIRRVGGLRDMPADVRIIAASNRDLRNSEAFREDLYFRLNNLIIDIPPLRDRKEDVIPLAEKFLSRYSLKYSRTKSLTPDACDALKAYDWPGNIRELRQLMERVTFLSDDELVSAMILGLTSTERSVTNSGSQNGLLGDFPDSTIDLENVEKELISLALGSTDGNVSEAARKLGISREALRYRLKKHDLS